MSPTVSRQGIAQAAQAAFVKVARGFIPVCKRSNAVTIPRRTAYVSFTALSVFIGLAAGCNPDQSKLDAIAHASRNPQPPPTRVAATQPAPPKEPATATDAKPPATNNTPAKPLPRKRLAVASSRRLLWIENGASVIPGEI